MTAYNRDGESRERPAARTPDPTSLEVAAAIKSRLGRRKTAPVRVAFVRRQDGSGARPPLAKLMSVGRGNDVRLKLQLSFLWFAASPPHDLTYPARAWATLLGLDDPDTNGARRVRQGITALREAGLVEVAARQGQPSTIYLLEESGSGDAYSLPGDAYNRLRNTPDGWRHQYFQVPDALWTSGWLSVLSGAALAMLLVLMAEQGPRSSDVDLWFSPRVARERYGLSDETRSKGLRELRAAGLITARRKAAQRDALDFRRVRNTYRIVNARFDDLAEVPEVIDPPAPATSQEASMAEMIASLRRVTR